MNDTHPTPAKRGRTALGLTLCGLPLLLGALTHGCAEGTGGNDPALLSFIQQITTAHQGEALVPGGPDSIGGLGTGVDQDTGDFVLRNDRITVVVDQPGPDPTSLGGAFPLSNVLAPTGGTIVDLANRFLDNDQWLQSGHGVLGLVTRTQGATGVSTTAMGNDLFIDAGNDFVAAGVAAGDTLAFASGPNAGARFRIAQVVDANTLALFVAPGLTYQEDLSGTTQYAVVSTTSPLDNIVVYDDAEIVSTSSTPATLRVTGGISNLNPANVPDGTAIDPLTGRLTAGGSEITVSTDYILFGDTNYVIVQTNVTNPSSGPIALTQVADVIATGGTSRANINAWTPLLGFQEATDGMTTPPGSLSSPVIVPFAAYQGRDEPGVSYAIVDPVVGHIIHASDARVISAAIQLSSASSTDANATLTWQRFLIVGDTNDVAAAADTAISLLGNTNVRTNPNNGTTLPNGYREVTTITGTVLDAPPGTRVTAIQVNPALIFDPGPPSGLTAAPGFYSSTILGAPELIINQTIVQDGTGIFMLAVPSEFAGLSPTAVAPADLQVPAGLERGSVGSTYRILVEAPGHDPQTVTFRIPEDLANNLQFDLRGETGTLELEVDGDQGDPIPATVHIIGVDPDGAGPAPRTADPVFGHPTRADLAEPRREGAGNVVHLVDGRGSVRLAPGSYRVVASRGIEWSAAQFPPTTGLGYFTIAAGQTVTTTGLSLTRVLDSDALPNPGGGTFTSPLRRYVSADFHVHAGGSFDSAVPLEDRVASFLAKDVEVLTSTEHDNITDLADGVADLELDTGLDLSAEIRTQIGLESTGFVPINVPGVLEFPNTTGHFNAWPLPLVPGSRRNGAPADEYRSPAILYEQLRAQGATGIQMNHPRFPIAEAPLPPLGLGFLTNGKAGYPQPNTGIAALSSGGYEVPLRSSTGGDGGLDDMNAVRTPSGSRYNSFDVFEVYSGNAALYDITRLDWFALISGGYVRTGTANSDTHDLRGQPGIPTTFVYADGDASADLGNLSLTDLNANVLPSLVQLTPGTTTAATIGSFTATERASGGANDMDVLGSSGIVVYVEVDADEDGTFEAQPGDLTPDDADAMVDVRITVLAAPWVSVSSLHLYVNGDPTAAPAVSGFGGMDMDLSMGLAADPTDPFSSNLSDVVRYRDTVTVSLPVGAPPFAGGLGDHWIVVEARGTPDSDSVYETIAPEIDTPIGFSNPVFIDTSMDGDWDPNGLP